MTVLSNDQVHKLSVWFVGRGWVVVVNVTRDCVAFENCIVPNLVFPTGVHDLRRRSIPLNSSMKFNIASTSSHLPLSLPFR